MTNIIQITRKNEQITKLKVSNIEKRLKAICRKRDGFKEWKHKNDNKNSHRIPKV